LLPNLLGVAPGRPVAGGKLGVGNTQGRASTTDIFRFLGRHHDRICSDRKSLHSVAAGEIALHRHRGAKRLAPSRDPTWCRLVSKFPLYLAAIVERSLSGSESSGSAEAFLAD